VTGIDMMKRIETGGGGGRYDEYSGVFFAAGSLE